MKHTSPVHRNMGKQPDKKGSLGTERRCRCAARKDGAAGPVPADFQTGRKSLRQLPFAGQRDLLDGLGRSGCETVRVREPFDAWRDGRLGAGGKAYGASNPAPAAISAIE